MDGFDEGSTDDGVDRLGLDEVGEPVLCAQEYALMHVGRLRHSKIRGEISQIKYLTRTHKKSHST